MTQLETIWHKLSFDTRAHLGLKTYKIISSRRNPYKTALAYLRVAKEHQDRDLESAIKELIAVKCKIDLGKC